MTGIDESGEGRTAASPAAEAVRAITRAILCKRAIRKSFIELLVAAGAVSPGASEAAVVRVRCALYLEELLDTALAQAIGDDDGHLARIRQFFLEPQDVYTLRELAALWRVSDDAVADVCHDEILQHGIGDSAAERAAFAISWAAAIGATVRFSLLRPFDVERALGEKFLQARSERWKTVPVLIRLPRFVAEAFQLDASIPPKVALAHRIEQVLLEFFTTEYVSDVVDQQ